MLIDDQESQLVLVDYQERLMPAIFEAESVLLNAKRLAQAAQWMEVPVWGTEQNPEKLGPLSGDVRQFLPLGFTQNEFQCLCGWFDRNAQTADPQHASRQRPKFAKASAKEARA
jgi:nicotinamidase-related amidase